MASIKIKFRPSYKPGCEGSIYYLITHERKARQLSGGYHLLPREWDERHSTVRVESDDESRTRHLTIIRERLRTDTDRFRRIIRRLESGGGGFTADDIINEFKRFRSDFSLCSYMGARIARLRRNGQTRTAETYLSALNSFRAFNNGADIMLDSLTAETVEAFEAWHRLRGTTRNTISFYMRILRAIYKRAVESDIIDDLHPFRRVYTGVDKTLKRALPLTVIRKIRNLNLTAGSQLSYARDMFMLSFMLRGMSFIDMAFLRKSDLTQGFIIYRRHKTGQQLRIEWTREMQEILDRYPANPTGYLLPVIIKTVVNERQAYKNALYRINKYLKSIAEMLGVSIPLTMYVARHSWASVAKSQGIPVGLISEGLGHDSEMTTRIYLASLDTSAVDRANSRILKSIR